MIGLVATAILGFLNWAPLILIGLGMANRVANRPMSQIPDRYARIHVNPEEWLKIFLPGRHIIIAGKTNSGKTTLAFYLLEEINNNSPGEVMLLVDGGKWETLDFAFMHPLNLFVPKGARLAPFEEPENYRDIPIDNIELIEYDPNKITEDILMKMSKRDRWNVVAFDPFYLEPPIRGQFWSEFVRELYMWQSRGFNPHPLTFFFDEIEKICSSRFYQTYGGQSHISAYIYNNIGYFRSQRLRLMGSAQNLGTLHKGMIEQFAFKFLKQHNQADMLGPYDKLFGAVKDMASDVCCLVMENGEYDTGVDVPQIIDPQAHQFLYYMQNPEELDTKNEWKQTCYTLVKMMTTPFELGGLGMKKKDAAILANKTPQWVTKLFNEYGEDTKGEERDKILASIAEQMSSKGGTSESPATLERQYRRHVREQQRAAEENEAEGEETETEGEEEEGEEETEEGNEEEAGEKDPSED